MTLSALPSSKSAAIAAITDEEFQKFSEFFYRRTGIAFTEAKRYFVDKRLVERITATECDSFRTYFTLLRCERQELEQLINALTVNETYFYREDHQFRCLATSILPAVAAQKRPGDTIRIWSMPCSTGEEPYSIAIWLLENWRDVDRYDVEIVGFDIDTRVVAAAAEGIFDERALMRLPRNLVQKYFEPCEENRWRILQELRNSVRFMSVNVCDPIQMARHRGADVIFCRNMLIYFDDASRREAAENLFDALRPGGWLCLGHSESMSRISPIFQVRRFPDAIVYQKPMEGTHA